MGNGNGERKSTRKDTNNILRIENASKLERCYCGMRFISLVDKTMDTDGLAGIHEATSISILIRYHPLFDTVTP